MPSHLNNYSIFIASPSGLDEVRRAFRSTVQEYNESDANHRQVHFSAIGWEETLGGIGRPQAIINEEIAKCDYFVLVLHDRWGSPSGATSSSAYSSGTEEEFHVALECYNSSAHCMRELIVFFKGVNTRQLSDPGDQLRQVLAFRRDREQRKDLLFHTFDTEETFRELLVRHLAKWVREHERMGTKIEQQETLAIDPARTWLAEAAGPAGEPLDKAISEAEDLARQGRNVEAEIAFSKIVVTGENPEALAHFGRFLRKTGQLSRAKQAVQESIAKSNHVSFLRTRAYATLQLARIEEDQGNVVAATELFRQANVQFEMAGDKKGIAKSYRNLGKALKKRGQLDDAEHALSQAANAYAAIGDDFGQASALGYLGLVFKSRGHFKEAEQAHRRALLIHEKAGNEKGKAIVWGNLGTVLRLQGKVEEALKLHEMSLEVHQKTQDQQGVARELSNLGTACRYLNRYEDSKVYHAESLRLSEELGNQHGIAIQLSCLGQVCIALKEFNDAERFHLRSLSISEQIGDKQGAAMQFKNLGTIYRLKQDLDKAEEAIRKGLSIDSENGFLFGVGKSKEELGKVMVLRKKYDHAKQLFCEAENAYLESGAQPSVKEVQGLLLLIEKKDWERLAGAV